MLPIVLAPSFIRAALVGAGPLAARRLAILRGGGIEPTVFCPDPTDTALPEVAGTGLTYAMPDAVSLKNFNVVLAAGLSVEQSETLAGQARALGILINVEDVVQLCDFHMPSIVRRGDLLFSISTAGRGPGLAGLIRRRLEALFPEAWAERLDVLGALRQRLRADGANAATINRSVEKMITDNGWLP
jgi:precorrin-2 dehydrogenase/sirohydrochlorin ferrochelatase